MEGRTHVFHLAALADIVPSIDSPLTYFDTNVTGTAVVAEAARTAGVEKFVYAASSSCYGIPDSYPTDEQAAIRPQYPYAFTKWMGEEAVRHWGQVYDLPWISLRLFNVYGPRSRTAGTYGAVFGVFLAQKLAGEPMTIVGDGEQRRDFTFVTDIARAFYMAAQSPHTQLVMNIGTGTAQSINELTSLLGGATVHVPKRPGEPDVTLANANLARTTLGWQTEVGFSEGVEIMLEHIDSWRDAPVWNPESIADATKLWFQALGSE
jgi:UDP-glucose 4-epimerase